MGLGWGVGADVSRHDDIPGEPITGFRSSRQGQCGGDSGDRAVAIRNQTLSLWSGANTPKATDNSEGGSVTSGGAALFPWNTQGDEIG